MEQGRDEDTQRTTAKKAVVVAMTSGISVTRLVLSALTFNMAKLTLCRTQHIESMDSIAH